eukprot:354237-Chlamydomonas_euryale.AAC.4
MRRPVDLDSHFLACRQLHSDIDAKEAVMRDVLHCSVDTPRKLVHDLQHLFLRLRRAGVAGTMQPRLLAQRVQLGWDRAGRAIALKPDDQLEHLAACHRVVVFNVNVSLL